MRILLLLLLPFIGYSQTSNNPYSSVLNEGNLYPTYPYQVEQYPSRENSSYTTQYQWDGNYGTGHFIGAAQKAVQSSQSYLGVPTAWAHGFNGTGVKICVIDGGMSVLTNHKDISVQGIYDPVIFNQNHSIQMVSLIAARDNGGSGVIGNAYNSDVYVGEYSEIAGSIDWGLAQGCRIFNCSFYLGDGVVPDSSIIGAFERVANANGVVIIASGNNTATLAPMQAMCGLPNTICVAAQKAGLTREFKDSAYTRNIQPIGRKTLDFATPCYVIAASNSTDVQPAGSYYQVEGGSSTSCAAISGGMYALLMQRFPTTPVKILTEMLKAHSHNFTNFGVIIHVPKIDWLR